MSIINYHTVKDNSSDDTDHRIYLKNENGTIVSPFHFVSLYPYSHTDTESDQNNRSVVSMIVEIPKNTNIKREISKEVLMNPIIYDLKNGNIRKVSYQGGYPYHYGALPQTWENCLKNDKFTNIPGDNDPMDCFDISDIEAQPGDVLHVKVLGCIAMIDQSEMDWKVISINVNDSNANLYNELDDVPEEKMNTIMHFLQNYKQADNKSPTSFYEKIYWSKNETLEIIDEQHHEWKNLMNMNSIHDADNKTQIPHRVKSISLHIKE